MEWGSGNAEGGMGKGEVGSRNKDCGSLAVTHLNTNFCISDTNAKIFCFKLNYLQSSPQSPSPQPLIRAKLK